MRDPLLAVQSRLTDRDHTLLGWLYDHGVLTSFQIAHALFGSTDFAQRRLRLLTDIGVLARFRTQKPDGGSYPYHYMLDQLGTDIVAAQRGDDPPRRDQARNRRWHLTNRANLPHLLASNAFFIDLAGHARTHPPAALQRWWSAAQCQRPAAFYEPGADLNLLAHGIRSRPDGHGIWAEHGRTVPFFTEVDLSTEPLGRLVDKIDGYATLARVTRRAWPVLFHLQTLTRERNLHQAFTNHGVSYPVATTAHQPASGDKSLADDVWWLHRHPGLRLRLADLADAVLDDRITA